MSTTLRISVGTILATLLAGGAAAQVRPAERFATPFEGPTAPLYLPAVPSDGARIASGGQSVSLGADNIVSYQCMDGGWGWPLICPPTYHNITAPIALGLLHAYDETGTAAYLNSATLGGDFDLGGLFPDSSGVNFASFMPAFFYELSDTTGNPIYANTAAVDYFDRLTAGTYGDPSYSSWYPTDTYGWIARLQAARSGALINLRPWDLHNLPWVAGELGNADSDADPFTPVQTQQDAFLDALLDGLNTLKQDINPASEYGDVIGLAGGVRGLALNGTTSFAPISSPAHPDIDGIDNLCDLTAVLASYQNPDGSWYWFSDPGETPGTTDKDAQTTAYCAMALLAADAYCTDYSAQIAAARQWLRSLQLPGGGFPAYPGGPEYAEIDAEIVHSLTVTELNLAPGDDCDADGTFTVRIDLVDADATIVGGQFFLSYNNAVLDFVSAVPGDAPFTMEIFETVNEAAGTIDYAVGIPLGGSGTSADTTMAVLTFNVLSEACATANLVQFRPHDPPTRLSDDQGGEVLLEASDLPSVTIDQTAPALTCPADVTTDADAGGCTAAVNTGLAPADWTLEYDAQFVATGSPIKPLALELSSVAAGPDPDYSAVTYVPPAAMTFADITHLAADYNMTLGCFHGGAPRFSIGLDCDSNGTVDGNVFVYWGTAPNFTDCPTNGQWFNTGDLITDGQARFDSSQLGGPFYGTHATTVASFGACDVKYVVVALDASWQADQVMLLDNVQIGDDVFSFGSPAATDNCDSAVEITGVRSDTLPLTDPYPSGTTSITWTATDDCGNFSSCVQQITVNAVNQVVVDLTLQGVSEPTLTRCIRFEFWDCVTDTSPSATVDQEVTFSSGVASAVVLPVDCGAYDCVTARDPLHTLRITADSLAIVGTQYVADFGSDQLIGGNLNDDFYIDILDFGTFVSQFGTNFGTGDTNCSTAAPHSDISGNGIVATEDFTFIQTNFLQANEVNCCGVSGLMGDDGGPVTHISVQELRSSGLGRLAVSDLNHDGWLDQADVAAFLAGARPDPQPHGNPARPIPARARP